MNIQIFGSSKSFDSKKAERWFKERRIKYQYIDLPSKGLSPREYQSVKQKVGFDALVNTKCRAYEDLYMAYITPDAREEKLLEHPELFVTPIVRNGREATVGYCPEIWQTWAVSRGKCGRGAPFGAYYGSEMTERGGDAMTGLRRRDWMEPPKNRFLRGIYLLIQRYPAAQCGDAGGGPGLLPAVHDLPPADLRQLPAGPAAAGCGRHSGGGGGLPAPGGGVLHRGVPHLCGPESQRRSCCCSDCSSPCTSPCGPPTP